MDITPRFPTGTNIINGYSLNGFRINNQLISHDIILSPTILVKWENEEGIFSLSSYQQIIKEIESKKPSDYIILLGTGHQYLPAPTELFELLGRYNISLEVMSTPAACRTYNVLASEQRNIYAMLINMSK